MVITGALVLLCAQYHYGIGLTADSAFYMSAADSLLNGHGLVNSIGTLPARLTHYPPGYPLLLAALKPIMGSFFSAATLLNFASLFCCFLATYLFLSRQAAWGPALIGVFLLACSTAVYSVHYTLGTDALAIPFLLAAIYWLGEFDRSRSRRALILSALALSGATLLRYAYLAFIPAALVVVLLDQERTIRIRIRAATLFGMVALAPLIVVFLDNFIRAGSASDRKFLFHPVSSNQLWDAAELSSWLLPYRIPVLLRFAILLLTFVPGVMLAVRGPWKYAARITISCLAWYAISLFATVSFLDSSTPFDDRLLAPAIVLLCLHIALVSGWLALRWPRWGAAAGLLLALSPALSGARRLLPQTIALYRSPEAGTSVSKVRQDYREVIPVLQALPPGSTIYTNVASDLFFVSGRHALNLPLVRGYTDSRPRTEAEIAEQVRELQQRLSESAGLVVYRLRNRTLSDLSEIWWDDLARRMPLRPVLRSDAFAVFTVDK